MIYSSEENIIKGRLLRHQNGGLLRKVHHYFDVHMGTAYVPVAGSNLVAKGLDKVVCSLRRQDSVKIAAVL